MRRQHASAFVAGAATLLATTPLASVFDGWLWLINGVVAVIVVIGTAAVARSLRAPIGIQVLISMAALLLLLTWRFPSGGEIAGLLPSAETLRHFNDLFLVAGQQVRTTAVPVPDLDGLLLLSTCGIGLVALLVDLAAVGIRRPALAGLPMLALYSVPVAVLPDGLSFVSFSLACAGFLWLLVNDSVDRVRRFGRRFSGEGRDVDAWEPSPLSAAGRRLGVVTIAAAVAIPLAVPAMTPTLLNTFGPGGGGSGPNGGGGNAGPLTSVDMNAMLRDNLTLDEAFPMVTVHTGDPNPYYLRLGVMERLDNAGFHADLPAGSGRALDQDLPDRMPAGPVSVQGRYRAQIEVTGLGNMGLAPAYTLVTGVDGLDGNWTLDENTDSIFSRRRSIEGASYTIDYVHLSFSPTALRTASDLAEYDMGNQVLTQVPSNQYVSDLVDDLTDGLNTEYDRVLALYEYFKPGNGFRYALSTIDGDTGSAIIDFLQNKQGFCVQYAAALGWLVREAGYPARVAVGFTRGNGRNGLYTLTNLNLHAWTEVYFPDFGWVPFDATPGGSVPGSARTDWAPDVTSGAVTPPVSATATASAGPAPNGGPDRGLDPGEATSGGSGTGSGIGLWQVVITLAVALALVLLVAPSLQRRARRRRRLAASSRVIALNPPEPGREDLVTDPEALGVARRDAHNAWAELLDTMIDYGVLVDPAETPRATVDRLTASPDFAPSGRPSTSVLARAEERARYAPAAARPTDLDEAIAQARASFAEYATRTERVRAALFPRSVLLRWRLAWYGLVARTTRRVGRIRNVLLLRALRERRR